MALQNKKMQLQFSAGGVVIKKEEDKTLVLIGRHSGHHGWVFPKGLIGDKENNKDQTKEETALREVKEETGISGKILKPLEPIEFWYVFEGIKIKKTVYYFLMEYVSGDISDHDWEMDSVEWINSNVVEKTLTYPSDKKVWREASKLL